MLKLLLLADTSSCHTVKWVRSLAASGIEICLFGFNRCSPETYASLPNVTVVSMELGAGVIRRKQGNYKKLLYLKALPKLAQIIADFNPDIVHAHYATSYGLLGALSGFRPYVLSVWGSDIFDFPRVSFLHRALTKFILSRSSTILSTSHVMAAETAKYTDKPIQVTPFGIDLSQFRAKSIKSFFPDDSIIVGTVKSLEPQYGIEYLIRAFRMVCDRHSDLPLRLLIVGGGSLDQSLKKLTHDLDLDDCVLFTGPVPHDEVSGFHNMLNVFVSVSLSESFGVAIVEASACEKAVVVSDVGGLPEVVEDGVTGIVVPSRDPSATAAAIERLVVNEELRSKMGCAGRERVARLYDWSENVNRMIGIYERILEK